MKLKQFALGLTVSIVFLSNNLSAAPITGEEITLRADVWAPFSDDPKEAKPGFMIEIAQAIFQKNGIKVNYEILPWARVLKEVGEGKFDGAVGASPDDAPDFVYPSEPQGEWTVACMVRSDNPWKYEGTIDSLKNLRVAAMLGYVYGKDANGADVDEFLAANKDKNIQILGGDYPLKTALQMLDKKRIDVVLETPEVFYDAIKKFDFKSSDFRIAAELRPRSPVWVGFSPKLESSKRYAEILGNGMTELRKSGELRKILDKYGISDWKKG